VLATTTIMPFSHLPFLDNRALSTLVVQVDAISQNPSYYNNCVVHAHPTIVSMSATVNCHCDHPWPSGRGWCRSRDVNTLAWHREGSPFIGLAVSFRSLLDSWYWDISPLGEACHF
jgi:hypothetical protein